MATNAQTSLAKIEDSIECSICTHRFRQPKWLNCFHTFCLQCLQEICKNQRPPSNKLPCPLCRQETILNGNVSDLPDNLDMKNLVNNFTQQENVLKQQFEQLQVFSTLVAKARRSKTEFELSGENIDKFFTKLDKVFLDTKEKISRKATKEVSRIRNEEQKLIKEAETIHKSKVEFLKSLQASDRREASQTARKLDEVNHLMEGGSNNGNKGQDFKKRICKDLEKAITKHPQSVPDGLTFMDLKENDVMISLGELVQNDADLTLLDKWTRQTCAKNTTSVLKYIYKEDQWSPLNPEGKRVYDRDFLLQFQGNNYERPKGLPYVPGITLEQPNDNFLSTAAMMAHRTPQVLVPAFGLPLKMVRHTQQPRVPVYQVQTPAPFTYNMIRRGPHPSSSDPQISCYDYESDY
ncbi:uncharacterized protein [Asterias amurensis]|uniref:uncharacterized protein isoform X1 n=1 Tax=Asterias amurensis TaxID=7602 RepID=UPI003AB732F4